MLVDTEKEHQIVPLDEDVSLYLMLSYSMQTEIVLCFFALQNDLNIVASFDRRGQHIYTGNSKGKVLVYQTNDLTLKASFKVMLGTASTTSIKSIEFARRGE